MVAGVNPLSVMVTAAVGVSATAALFMPESIIQAPTARAITTSTIVVGTSHRFFVVALAGPAGCVTPGVVGVVGFIYVLLLLL